MPSGLVLPTPAGMASELRQMALVVSGEAGRAAVAVEGRWDGTIEDPDLGTRRFELQLRSEGGRLAGTLTTWRGKIELKAPVRDIGFDRGNVRFTVDQQGTAYRFKGTLEENTVTGTIERAGKPPASFTLRSWSRHHGPRPHGAGAAPRPAGSGPGPARRPRRQPLLDHGGPRARLGRPEARRGVKLAALFGPEHGIAADAQDLVEVGHSRDRETGLPVHSLYGETRVPTPAMLAGVDAMVFDVQDVGSRYYTFAYTMLHVMEACAREGKRVVVLDRPNPIGGDAVDGNVLDPEYRSFVGMHPLAVRHGMTVGELALMFREELSLDVDLRVVPMKGWRRRMAYEDTGLPWVLPSPNIPTVDTAFVYPGGCLVEGTNLSEGRGTTRPFELVGAPWLDGHALARALERERIPGAGFRAAAFTPTFQKHVDVLCHGVQVHVLDRARFPAFLAYLLLIHHARRQDPGRFAWRAPPVRVRAREAPLRHPLRDGQGPEGDRVRASRRSASPPGGARSRRRSGSAGRSTCSTDRRAAP